MMAMPPEGIISWGTPKSVGILIDGQWHELGPVNDIPSLEPIDNYETD